MKIWCFSTFVNDFYTSLRSNNVSMPLFTVRVMKKKEHRYCIQQGAGFTFSLVHCIVYMYLLNDEKKNCKNLLSALPSNSTPPPTGTITTRMIQNCI